ncbi:hypothetical protein B6V00_04015 [ANME-1 cluster archaeon ex4572_4]|nr:hypothetical protein [Methanophagales archaeon]OYT65992.1 MAG: hypothetical protein B6V00_04015 [ANME-1 cluster archaeon ex4572_4]PXF51125.1 MAG: hypothetical protein C4B55_01530 [Methanophagales archaeon]HDN68447.1 hypothetical protein [Methanomicrobia archaeon]
MKFCPKCGSNNLNYLPWLGEIYECRDCGYRGALVVEDGEMAEALKDAVAGRGERQQNDK